MPSERFTIGATVLASDGECGHLARVVVDPLKQSLTHLVVTPRHQHGLGRLVPVEMVKSVEDDDAIRLDCTTAEFHELDDAEDIHFLPADTDMLGYGPHAMMWPYFNPVMPLSGGPHRVPMLSDRVPLGEVEVHRGDEVHASDGWIGSVEGLVVDPADHHVTHVLLQEGHLFERKQVAIPIGATTRVDQIIRVGMTRDQVAELPAVKAELPPVKLS